MKVVLGSVGRRIKLWGSALCAVVLGLFLLVFTRRPREALRFEIVDYVTGKRIQGATVELSRKWTRLPVESLPLLTIKPHYHRSISAESGVAQIAQVPDDRTCRIVVQAKGYGDAFIQQQPPDECDNPDVYRIVYFGSNWLHESAYEYVNRKKPFTVALEPDAGGAERKGARYEITPSSGSKERAIAAINASGDKRGANGKQINVGWAKFRNGHWEIKLSSEIIGGDTQYDVSQDAEILGIHPGE